MTARQRGLGGTEKRRLAMLGLPTFALALAITIVSTYVPTVAREMTASATVIGIVVGGEGLFALVLPVLVGTWSDRVRTPLGGRLPFILAGVPVAVLGLAALAAASSIAVLAIGIAIFFAGYFVAYEPYRAMYPDLVRESAAGRAQSTQAVWRGLGTVAALVAGGLLLALGQPAPFALAAAVLVLATAVFVPLVVREGAGQTRGKPEEREPLREMLRDSNLRAFFVANMLWELALGALKTFVILWLTRGLGISLSGAALGVGAVALFVLAGGAVSGKLGDRYGRRRVMLVAVSAFGVSQLVPLLVTSTTVIAVSAPLIAFAGGVLLSLPYALLVPLMPPERHGALTGFYSVSRGFGVMLGPLLGGAVISLAGGVFESTEGYAAVWGVCAIASLASVPFLRRIDEPRR